MMALRLLGREELSERLVELQLFSPSLGHETTVRVLQPRERRRTDPPLTVLYLLHGGGIESDCTNWTKFGDAEAVTEGLPLLAVMPDGGAGGWYANWMTTTGPQGPQQWENYHVGELLPFVRDHFGTRRDRSGTAILGLSMGGFGAIHYAARHPDLFGFAASFSGALDPLHDAIRRIINQSPLVMGGAKGDIWGERHGDLARWRANSPVELANNLATVQLQLRTGNGHLASSATPAFVDEVETAVCEATGTLHHRLNELGIEHLFAVRPGQHTWNHWSDALRDTLPAMIEWSRTNEPPPDVVHHVAFEPSFSVWGYDVAIARSEFIPTTVTFGPWGFSISSAGPATGTVTTPPLFAASQVVTVTTDCGSSHVTDQFTARADGRLEFVLTGDVVNSRGEPKPSPSPTSVWSTSFEFGPPLTGTLVS